jgi:hypothetical protein
MGDGDRRVLRIPGLSRAGAAVAYAHLRLATRTPRGRSTLLSPFIVFTMIALVSARRGSFDLGFAQLANGLAVATFGSVVYLISILPFAMNQFAIDRAGLTLTMLSPIRTRDFLAGKAVGNGVIAIGPALVCLAMSFAIFRDGSAALWLSLVIAIVATYALMAPAAAALSAIFPRQVDLNSIGRGSNAHGVAGLIGFATVLAAAAPPALIAALSIGVLERPSLTLVLMLVWCGVALAVSWLLFRPIAILFDKRRENLGLVAT